VFHRVTLRATDRDASEGFYDTVLATLGIERGQWGGFAVVQADAERPATRGLHIGFGAPTRAEVDEFWRAGTAAGYRDDGQPGPRPEYVADYYGGFLLDPDGNSAEAVHHDGVRRDGLVDHLWIRVADLAASKRFYEAIAPRAGFRLRTDTPERAGFRACLRCRPRDGAAPGPREALVRRICAYIDEHARDERISIAELVRTFEALQRFVSGRA